MTPIKHHVLVGDKCRIFKNPNYGNEMEGLGPEYETWNNVCVCEVGSLSKSKVRRCFSSFIEGSNLMLI